MATAHQELKTLLLRIEAGVNQLSGMIPARQIAITGGLSDIDNNLGLINAGEFRAGNNRYPGDGFSGMRIAYPPMSYSNSEWNIVGISNDVLQFGIRASDGVLVAGADAVVLDQNGISILDGTNDNNLIRWVTAASPEDNVESVAVAWINGDAVTATEHELHLDAGAHTDAGPSIARNFVAASSKGGGSSNSRLMISNVTADSLVAGKLVYNLEMTREETTNANYLSVYQEDETVFNESGDDQDFRFEGANNANLLKGDAGTDSVSVDGFFGHAGRSELTIAAGVVTATRSFHNIDTQDDDPSDELNTVNGGVEGDRLLLRAANNARTVVCKDGGGNLLMAGDFSIDATHDLIEFIKIGSSWVELSRSDNA